ncbi:MAG: hypothetical protein PHU25_15565 [Deltaproteobacteria bacterium]|nr:hypothetical protein [Deltaproteobacteria bacterium]
MMRARGGALDVALAAVFAFMTMGATEFPCEGDHHHDADGTIALGKDASSVLATMHGEEHERIATQRVPDGVRPAGGHQCHCLCHVPGSPVAGTTSLNMQVFDAMGVIVPGVPNQGFTSRLFRPPSRLLAIAA